MVAKFCANYLKIVSQICFYVLFCLIFGSWICEAENEGDIYPQQPRIVTENGHLVFMTAANRNITFRSKGGGKIRVNEEDLDTILISAKRSVAQLEMIRNEELVRITERILALETQTNSVTQISGRINDLESRIQQASTLTNSTQFIAMQNRLTQLNRRLTRLVTQFNTMKTTLERDECLSNPCLNGATCHDNYNKVYCSCPDNWEGPTCSNDVNECLRFTGTSLGCQNGGTCQNTYGGYNCLCPPDWYGVHCTEKHDDCSSASSEALCAHGTCVNQPRTQSGRASFMCICHEGWTKNDRDGACNVDVDECSADRRSPCSTSPAVRCINLPGSFTCGSCPSGYSGNGYNCDDINECQFNNGGCSTAPLVQCINHPGSRQCGPCPAGYQGNGEICVYVGVCRIDNGGCHPLATCVENLAISSNYRECRCPAGYQGSGVGAAGCIYQSGGGSSGSGSGTAVISTGDPCTPNPCVQGSCTAVSSTVYHCNCPIGFTGQRCEIDVNECLNQPCMNGGTCVDGVGSYRCICSELYTGSRCQQIRDNCGGYLNGDNGTLVYPVNQLTQYPHNRSCAWVITTSQQQKVLNLTFVRFDLEPSPNCDFDFLQIHDGNSAAGHPLGRFCSTNPPRNGNIITTHNTIYLWFFSDHSVSREGFTIKWNTIDPICGGRFTEPKEHGTIKSPGYPGKYPLNRDCIWMLKVPNGKKMQLSFATLQLEHHDNCDYDYVKIRDGWRDNDPVLATYCSTMTPPPLQTSGSDVRVEFHSDHSNNDVGFLITYNSVPGIPGCGGLLTGAQGSISSPDHPNRYENGLECDWLIRGHPNDRIKLTFTAMDIEFSASNCQWDFVEAFDGSDDTAISFGRRCGRNLPQPIISSSNTMLVKFRTDHSVSMPGFRAIYEIVCGGLFTATSGVLHSPYYPDPYPSSRECIYLIRVPIGNSINLAFQAFDVEGSSTCLYDYLEIRDGDTETSPLLGHYCGADIPEAVESTFNVMWLKFKTDASVQNRGFLANYSTIDIGCGGIFHNQSTGAVTSPNHPDVYLNNVTCRWIIRPPSGYLVRLTFNTFSLESHWQCNFDYLAVYDNVTTEDPQRLMGKFCGTRTPPTLISSDNLIYIIFKTDHSVARDGFSLTFNTFDASTSCGGEYYTSVGVIRSPNYPNNYRHGLQCVWVIKVESGKQIRLNVTSFQLESHSQCHYDYLEIRNGGFMTSPSIGRFCGAIIPQTITSHSNQLRLELVTDHSMSAAGFEISWDASLTGCGGEMTASEGTLSSPNYPMSCRSGVTCQWRIKVNSGNRIRMVITDLDTLSIRNCAYGLKIYNGQNNRGSVLANVCGNHVPDPISSTGNEAFVEYQCSPYISTQRGFQMSYTTDCNLVLRGRRGVVESPNFPQPYPHNRNCSWTIEAPLANLINLSFTILRLEAASDCRYDYLQLTNLVNRSSIGRYCREGDVAMFIPTGTNRVGLNFVSDYSHADDGFSLEWVTSGCGGDLRKPQGSFSSPNYPNHYPNHIVCEWTIQVAMGHGIELTILEYDMERGISCNYDFLKIYSGFDDRGILLTTMCEQKLSPVIVTSSGNRMFIRFKSDVSIAGRGFSATYITRPEGCGGLLTTVSGVIHSRNYPTQYPPNEDCTWLVRVAEGHTIDMRLTDVDIPQAVNCSNGYLAVFDGENETLSQQLLISCNSTPVNITTSRNTALLRLKGVAERRGRGFSLDYNTRCGGILQAGSTAGVVNSFETFSLLYNNCTWIVQAKDLEDRVSWTFTDIQAQWRGSWSCRSNFIAVYEGESNSSALIRKICDNQIPPTITSRGNILKVTVINTYRYGTIRFRATYHQTSAFCGGVIDGMSGSFASPEYPDSYPLNIECVWTLKASLGNKISLSFSSFDVEQSDFCNGDYLEVRENDASGSLLNRMCGSDGQTNVTATANQLWVKFRSDNDGTAAGFVAQYSHIHNVQLSGLVGEVTSPLFPRHITGSLRFSWTITVPEGSRIRITFLTLDNNFSSRSRTCLSPLTIFDGPDRRSRQMGRFCGGRLPDPIVTIENVAFIVLASTSNQYRTSFRLRWEATGDYDNNETAASGEPSWITTQNVAGCVGVSYLNDSQFITVTSPGYPNGYPPNLKCEWIINTLSTNHFSLHWNEVNLENSYRCQADYVQILLLTPGEERFVPYTNNLCRREEENAPPIQLWSHSLRLRFNSDSSVNFTGFSVNIGSVCGGNISASSGVLRSPSYPSNYPANQRCDWQVTVRPGRTIRIEMNDFQLEGTSPSCQNDYLLLHNGFSSNSPVLGNGKFCGTTPPNQFLETTANHLFIQFVSNSLYSYKGFELRFSEVSVECGGVLMLSDDDRVIFNSPNFPSTYPQQTQCEWRIIGPARKRLKLDFIDHFDIPSRSNCQQDYVSVYDGGSSLSTHFGQFCGHEIPSTIISSSNLLFVQFSSQDPHPSTGFKASITISECGGTIVSQLGTIHSPNYPHGYSANLNCEWILNGLIGHFFIFNFVELQTSSPQGSNNCSGADTVLMRDFNHTGPILGSYCGQNVVPSFQSSDNHVYIRFNSSTASALAGFLLRFNTSVEECGGQLSNPNGVITSPNFPRPYPQHRHCQWRIWVEAGRKIRLRFTHFDLDDSEMCLSRVTIGSDPSRDYQQGVYLCGTTIPNMPLMSTSNFMKINFYSTSATGTGFRAVYDSDLEGDCGGELPVNTGFIASPGFNNGSYMHNQYCYWTINNPSNENVTYVIEILHLELEIGMSGNCAFDKLDIHSGLDANGPLLASLCGNRTTPFTILLPFSQLFFYFVSDYSVAYRGFNLSYTIANCGGEIGEMGGVIYSPGYPSNYPNEIHCAWVIRLAEGQQAKITFEEMQLESSDGCSKDYILVRNGLTIDAPVINRFCGTSPSTVINTQRHLALIEFHSDNLNSARGFKILVASAFQGCSGIYHGENGQLSSVNFPGAYPPNLECEWQLEANTGFYFVVAFVERFDIEQRDNCASDFVEGFDFNRSDSTWISMGRHCGRIVPSPYVTQSNRFRLVFRTNDQVNGDGFKVNWTKSCGGFFDGNKEGFFTSPDYPVGYSNLLNCSYVITPPMGHFIVLTFDDTFELEDAENCRFDVVKIFDGNTTLGPLLRSSCGNRVPPVLSWNGPVLVKFTTDESVTKRGFRVNYKMSECGGNLTDSSGEITSPTAPDIYHNNMYCAWKIQGPPDKIIEIKFLMIDIEGYGSYCHYDHVSFYNGAVNSSNMFARYCGTILPPIIRSEGSLVNVVFATDSSYTKKGFRLLYRFTYGPSHGCGGAFNSSSGTIQSLDIDRDGYYESGLVCDWTVAVDMTRVIQINFTRFDVEKPPNRDICPWDYLEIRDGFSPTSSLIGRFCGNQLPPSITTSGAKLFIRFVSDESYNKAGFTLIFNQIQAPCGGFINESGIIQTPNYPANYPINTRCRWMILSSFTPYFLIFQFQDFELESSAGCQKDMLNIKTGYSVIDDPYQMELESPWTYNAWKQCGSIEPFNRVFRSRWIILDFASDSAVTAKGFKIEVVRSICNETSQSSWGVVEKYFSLNPRDGVSQKTCVQMIETPLGSSITLIFTYLSASVVGRRSTTCEGNYVEIRSGPNETSPFVAKLCGYSSPDPFFISGNVVRIKAFGVAASSNSWGSVYYRAQFISTNQGVGCGGRISEPTGVIVSPNYPGNYPQNAVCRWDASVSHHKRMNVNFAVINFGPMENCTANYIQLFDGELDDTDRLIATICPGDNVRSFSSSTNSMVIKYITSTANTGTGFKLTFTQSTEDVNEPLVPELDRDPS